MVTMLDVAKKAGVSKATVSRVLNGKNIVRPDVVSAVFKAIQETGYRPNLLARQLATQQTNFVGLVITNALFNGPYFSSLVYHAATFTEQRQHQLVIADGKHSAQDERDAINFLTDMRCKGIVVYPKYLSDEQLGEIIDKSPIPIVVVNHQVTQHPQCTVASDHYQSACRVMQHMVEKGHQSIAFIAGRENSFTGTQRLKAYRDMCHQHALDTDPRLVVQGDWTPQSGYLAAKQLIASGAEFSAILAGNDEMALGAIKALFEHGYRVPEDVSIAGFDNINLADFVTPSLTSVSIPLEQMAQKGVLMILGEHEQAQQLSIQGELIERNSIFDRST
ncbi:LacI family DNA-binding transcriptional regulator [Vibrio olivae]|uniref:LacI family DNA-binding transcriptional regulator n=1 Tax=Vibrio olivae TaxID=1243002 RepID=A0ABV5HHX7_9VIBR